MNGVGSPRRVAGATGPLVALALLLVSCTTSAAPTVPLGRAVTVDAGEGAAVPVVVDGSDARTTTTLAPAIPAPAVPSPPPVPSAAPPGGGPPPATPGVAAPPSGELTLNSQGPAVLHLEQRLDALRYDVGAVDGVFDRTTAYAVTAFQKVQGLARTGKASEDVVAAITGAVGTPPPLRPDGGPDRVEVDLARQVLFLYRDATLAKILPVSSGNNRRFCSEGWCRKAVTPTGSFTVYRQGRPVEKGPLGVLYRPQYFNGGIAIHGSPSVPASPASHGCIRIPMNASQWFPGQVAVGTPVFVEEGPGPATTGTPVPALPAAAVPAPPPPAPTTAAALVAPIAPLLGILSPPTTVPPTAP